jgi:hypothetical protein
VSDGSAIRHWTDHRHRVARTYYWEQLPPTARNDTTLICCSSPNRWVPALPLVVPVPDAVVPDDVPGVVAVPDVVPAPVVPEAVVPVDVPAPAVPAPADVVPAPEPVP